jgi:hypothetical protein
MASAQDEAKTEPAAPAKPTRAELRDKQLDVSLETRDIERVLTKVKRASELAKTRIADAAKTAESASTALEKGDSTAARDDVKKTVEMYQEIIKQLEALLAEETPQRVAAARNLAQRLAKMEREFAKQFPGMMNQVGSGAGKVDPKSQMKPGKRGQGSGVRGQKEGDNPDDPMNKDGGGKDQPATKRGAGDKGTPDKSEDSEGDGAGGKKKEDGANPDDPMKNGGGSGKDKNKEKPGTDETGASGKTKDKDEGDGAGGQKDPKSGDDPKDPKRGGESDKGDEPNDDRGEGSGGPRKDKPMTEEERREALAKRAEQLEKTGETLKDVLQAISQSNDPADKDAVAKLEALLKETELLKAIEAMKESSEMIRSEKYDDARLASLDLAERLEIVAQRLDAAYRAIIAPQAEELRKLEQALADLREKLDELETQGQIAAWHREAQELLDRADKLGISDKVRDDLLEEMKKAGLGINGARNRFDWGLVNNRYEAPASYVRPLLNLQEEVQARIQNLLLGDISSAADDATPPKYQDLVERYYQVLSGTPKTQISNSKSQANPKSETKARTK